MSGKAPIVLLTDFGWDVYVGVMKGVIYAWRGGIASGPRSRTESSSKG